MGERVDVAQSRQKNSIALKEKQLVERANGAKRYARLGFFQLKLFPVITVCTFLSYWFVICPLLFHLLYNENITKNRHWPSSWSFVYWLVAFLIWLALMLIFVLVWRSLKSKYTKCRKSKLYPTIYLQRSKETSLENANSEGKGLESGKGNLSRRANSSENSEKESKKRKDLPPLVIHRRMSGNDVENNGTVNVEGRGNFAEDEALPKTDDRQRCSEGALSPRELFFIDLIREAEKVERNKESEISEGSCFFPKNFSIKNEQASKKTEKRNDHAENEASYFIANVESPLMEKSEIYLEVGPDLEYSEEWIVNWKNEKPALILENNSSAMREEV